MNAIDEVRRRLAESPLTWLVTGSAGFIGSHLLEALLRLDQTVISVDNFATGHRRNLDAVRNAVTPAQWLRHRFVEGDIADFGICRSACENVHAVLHQAALGSVPRSLADPLASHAANVNGFLNLLVASRDAGVQRFVYASSSAVYGDHAALPKVEDRIGNPLSPYAVTKLTDELYADVLSRCYGMSTVGLRYFNVFGARQDPDGAYAAVIPRWIGAMLRGQDVVINGDGETSRDFCYIDNVVQANLLAATAHLQQSSTILNVALNDRTTLNELFVLVRDELARHFPEAAIVAPRYADFRPGDVRHSQADITKARQHLGYEPMHHLVDGLRAAMPWYVATLKPDILATPRVAMGT